MQEKNTVIVTIAAILQGGFFLMKNPLGISGFEERTCGFAVDLPYDIQPFFWP